LKVRAAHTPDADDAFMFYAVAENKIETGGLEVQHVFEDIETLNRRAAAGEGCDLTAISAHAYAYLRERYVLLESGGSFGLGWGPVVVSREIALPDEIKDNAVAVPGRLTTAALLARIRFPEAKLIEVPFREVIPAVLSGRAAAGIVIHEEQLTFAERGVRKLLDFGEWWAEETSGLPLPLGLDAVRRDLPKEVRRALAALLRASIEYALAHREEALAYAMRFAPEIAREKGDRFVGMYVNELTLSCGEKGRAALRELYRRAAAAGVTPEAFEPEFEAER